MGIENRPYIGTFQLANTELVQHTPDALVYLNGDTSVPGCPKCNGKIDIQKFITEVSVDAGTTPASASATFTLSIPLHHNDSFARDAKFLLRPGLEVHIYERGYFPVKGLYSNLGQPTNFQGSIGTEAPPVMEGTKTESRAAVSEIGDVVIEDRKHLFPGLSDRRTPATQIAIHETVTGTIAQTEDALTSQNLSTHYVVGPDGEVVQWSDNGKLAQHLRGANARSIGIEIVNHYHGRKADRAPKGSQVISAIWAEGGSYIAPPERQLDAVWRLTNKVSQDTDVPMSYPGDVDGKFVLGELTDTQSRQNGVIAHQQVGDHEDGAFPTLYMAIRSRGYTSEEAYASAIELASSGQNQVSLPEPKVENISVPTLIEPPAPVTRPTNQGEKSGQFDPSLLEQAGLSGSGIEDLLAYPYYHVFHGVVISVAHSYSGGVNQVTVQCASMLHFWQFQPVSTNASVFGARPVNSGLKVSYRGHNLTGMHPYEIMYTLHHDTVGSTGGVGYALSQKTNQTAVSPVSGESLRSLHIQYWEQRFAERQIRLRLHGAAGELFSAAQAAYLSRTTSKKLMRLVRQAHAHPETFRPEGRRIFSRSRSMALFNRKIADALTISAAVGGGLPGADAPQAEIVLSEIQPFVNNLSNYGQLNLFESSYESKLDVAQKVMEVTGFEFYQDVDGDFVFKPPMFNLDTSSSRTYRIEDIDIISINFDEKEPQVTYMTGKNAHFKDLAVGGLDNEWGHRADYVDYRLVAQYGWRPGSFETSYLNNPAALFYSGMNRMDLLNAPSLSASVTIPQRPELRPGYPVYIAYLDCFYYCGTFAHSHSVGGQSTTTLQLVGKRSKFYAPGMRGSKGIEAIDLSDTLLPERPLEVLDNAGVPRLAGFPNVVMALDPKEVNPFFFVVGSDLERLDDPDVLNGLLKKAVLLHILEREEGSNKFLMTVGGSQGEQGTKSKTIQFTFQGADFQETYKNTKRKARDRVKPSATVDILKAAGEYVKRQVAQNKAQADSRDRLATLNTKIATLSRKLAQLNPTESASEVTATKAQIKQETAARDALTAQFEESRRSFDLSVRNEVKDGIGYLLDLIEDLGDAYGASRRGTGLDFVNLEATHNLLDLLSSKKATFGIQQPGRYRYYSASHPDRLQQGQLIADQKPKKPGEEKGSTFKNPVLDEDHRGRKVRGFVPSSQIRPPVGAKHPEAQFGDIEPEWGIQVLTGKKAKPRGEVIPTSDIKELVFASHKVVSPGKRTSVTRKAQVSGLGKTLSSKLRRSANLSAANISPALASTITQVYYGGGEPYLWWGRNAAKAVVALRSAVEHAARLPRGDLSSTVPAFPALVFPSSVKIRGTSVSTTAGAGTFRIEGSTGGDLTIIGKDGSATEKWSVEDFFNHAGPSVAHSFFRQLDRGVKAWYQLMVKAGFKKDEAAVLLSAFTKALSSGFGVRIRSKASTKTIKNDPKTTFIQSPVFPVSDDQGYEVFGAYRYGRGVDIEPKGVFDVLHKQDPFQLLDRETVEDLIDVIINRQGIPKRVASGKRRGGRAKTSTSKQSLTQSFNDVEKRVLEQLRKNLTDKQILDLGLAELTEDPTQLTLSLVNWFADQSKDGIQKLPINNAAFSLAELNPTRGTGVCSCKVAEADVLLESLANAEFLKVQTPGGVAPHGYVSGEDETGMTGWLTTVNAEASVSWKQSQDALRGKVLDRQPKTSLIGSFQDFKEAESQAFASASDRVKKATESWEAAKDAALAKFEGEE